MRDLKFDINVVETYLSSCCYVTCDTHINGKSWLKWTSSGITIIIVEIIGFKVKYTRKAALGRFMYQKNLLKNYLKRLIKQLGSSKFITCTREHCIRLCICVRIRCTICSIVLCSSKIIRAKSNSTWFRLISNWDFSYSWAFRRPIPQNCR